MSSDSGSYDYESNASYVQRSSQFDMLPVQDTDIVFAGAALYMLPMLFIYFYFQDDIVSGLQLSELK